MDKQLEGDETKMDDEQELHYYEMQIPHEEQFEVEQSKNYHDEEKMQQEHQSLEGEEVHKHEDESPHEEQFEVQQVRKDHKEQRSQGEKQLQVEQCKSQEELEKIQQECQSLEGEEVHKHKEESPHEEQFEVQEEKQEEELAQVHEFDHRPSLTLCCLVDSNTFHFHAEVEPEEIINQQHHRHSRRCQKK